MAKALYGHLGGPDIQLVAEVHQLRRRIRDLEDEVDRLSATNEALATLVTAAQAPDDLADLERVELPAEVSVTTDAALTHA